jgi:hypothetical protein
MNYQKRKEGGDKQMTNSKQEREEVQDLGGGRFALACVFYISS